MIHSFTQEQEKKLRSIVKMPSGALSTVISTIAKRYVKGELEITEKHKENCILPYVSNHNEY